MSVRKGASADAAERHLVRKARVHAREADVWAAQLLAELAPVASKGAP